MVQLQPQRAQSVTLYERDSHEMPHVISQRAVPCHILSRNLLAAGLRVRPSVFLAISGTRKLNELSVFSVVERISPFYVY